MERSAWVHHAIKLIESDFNRSADTHLIKVSIPSCPEIDLYLKDESTHPTGSLKHRLARSLFLYHLCNGAVGPDTTVIEASSGSTAVSEAYFARMLGLPFVAVIPRATSREKVSQIEFQGGRCQSVEDPGGIYEVAAQLARQTNGCYLDQFTYAERATDWRGNNNIAESIFHQLSRERFPNPAWVVVGAGTGGTSATIGRYLRYRALPGKLCVVDPEQSVFFDYFSSGDGTLVRKGASGIEGIGRPRVEPSFVASVIDRMIRVANADSIAAARFLSRKLGRGCGGSTGTSLIGVIDLVAEMRVAGAQGSIVTLLCDGAERYRDSYFDDRWLQARGFDIQPTLDRLEAFWANGVWSSHSPSASSRMPS
ncbi:MAG: PLP-dependent cysteine synthase family protein [Gammaproteobacteria bacterium]|nr:PLP-dependent cysteine synthase family protein [Gammaproteobacteria bacterium]